METSFADWLTEELEKREMRQVDLAKRSGLAPAQISRILSGQRGAEGKTLRAIALALKLPPEKVFRAAGFMPDDPAEDETLYRIKTLYHTLQEPENRYKALEFLEFLTGQEEKQRRKNGKRK